MHTDISRRGFTDEERRGMRIVEGLLAEGRIALGEDPWRQGAPGFAPPHIVARWKGKASVQPGRSWREFLRRAWRVVAREG